MLYLNDLRTKVLHTKNILCVFTERNTGNSLTPETSDELEKCTKFLKWVTV